MHTIYNTYVGALQYGMTFSRSTMNLSLAKSLHPEIKANEIKKGMKLYDWEHALWFSLNIGECMKLIMWWESGKHDQNFHLIHKSQDGNTFCDFHLYNGKYYLTISKGKENRVQMPLDDVELRIFLKTVKWVTENMVAMTDLLTEMGKVNAGKSSFNPGNDRNGKKFENGQSNGEYNQNNGEGTYEAPPTPPTNSFAPPPAPPSVPAPASAPQNSGPSVPPPVSPAGFSI